MFSMLGNLDMKGRQSIHDPFHPKKAFINGRFNENHPLISRVYANVNFLRGPSHYQFKNWNPTFGDIKRYKLIQLIGDGRYSEVFLSLQDNTRKVAIKVLKPVNNDRVRRELKILQVLQGQENVLELIDIVIDSRFGIPSMVMGYVSNTPWRELFASFNLDDIRFYVYRILQALEHTHKNGIIHRDVKPLNILCKDPRKKLVLADWGLAEFYHPLQKYSVHVATKYYKAPELLVNAQTYDYSIDIWSVGVLFLESLTLNIHVFDSDDNEDMIGSIAQVLGSHDILQWIKKYRIKISRAKKQQIGDYPKVPFENLFPRNREKYKDPVAIDLLNHLLVIDHKNRMTAAEALDHPFFVPVKLVDEQRSRK